jgi:hypothetical protein
MNCDMVHHFPGNIGGRGRIFSFDWCLAQITRIVPGTKPKNRVWLIPPDLNLAQSKSPIKKEPHPGLLFFTLLKLFALRFYIIDH